MTSPLPPTPGQTVGPFFHQALPWPGDNELVTPGRADAVRLGGVVRDGAGDPVPDALVEIWQADADGRVPRGGGSLRRDGWGFTGFGRAATRADGTYVFSTVRPGRVDPAQAPYVAVAVFARGLLDRLLTRAYLPGDDAALAADPLLAALPPERRHTLVARAEPPGYRFDIRLQGDGETVFLDHRGSPGGRG